MSVLKSYFISYFGVVLLSCSIVGVFLCYLSAKDLKEANNRLVLNKTDMVLNDFQAQYEIMKEVTSNIYVKDVYKPQFFSINKYYELALLEDFTRYSGRSSITDKYFMFFRFSDHLFLSSGTTIQAKIYFEINLGLSDGNGMYEYLNAVIEDEVYRIDEAGLVVFIFRISKADYHDAIMCFIGSDQLIKKRIEDVSGSFPGEISVKFKDRPIFTSSNPNTGISGDAAKITPSRESSFSAVVYPEHNSALPLYLVRSTTVSMIVLFLLLLISFASFLAYRNYKPIQMLAHKHKSSLNLIPGIFPDGQTSESSRNELETIEAMFQMVLDRQKLTSDSLKEKLDFIRRQMLWIILKGEFTGNMMEQLNSVNISFPHTQFCVLAVKENASLTFNDIKTGLSRIGIEKAPAYVIDNEDERSVLILVNIESEGTINDILQQLRSMVPEGCGEMSIGVGSVCHSISQVPASCLEALSKCDIKENVKDYSAGKDLLFYDKEPIFRMIRAIKVGNVIDAEIYLSEFCSKLKERSASVLFNRYVFSDVLGELVETGRQLQCPLSEFHISEVLTARDYDSFFRASLATARYLCIGVDGYKAFYWNDMSSRIVKYINDNYINYDISLEMIASEFGISLLNASHIIREATGRMYKDYLIDLRIGRAKELLLKDGCSVSETSQMVGYTSTPHFIKLFKKKTGVTPAVFQKAGNTEKADVKE